MNNVVRTQLADRQDTDEPSYQDVLSGADNRSTAPEETPDPDENALQHLEVKGQRPGKKTVPGIILDHEVMNDDRTDEILKAAHEETGVTPDLWTTQTEEGITVDWDSLREHADPVSSDFPQKMRYWEERYEQPDELMIRFWVAPHEGMYFEAGDFAGIELPDAEADSQHGDTPRRVYSISNSPQESADTVSEEAYQNVLDEFGEGPHPYVNDQEISLDQIEVDNALEFIIKVIPDEEDTGHSLTPRLYDSLISNPVVQVRGADPHHLSLYEPSDRDIVFVGTGTGGAPLRSMLQKTIQENDDIYDGKPRDVWFFHGAAQKDVSPCRDEFHKLDDEHDNFHYIDTLSRESAFSDWDGEETYVQQCLLKYTAPETVDESALTEEQRAYLHKTPEYDIDNVVDMEDIELYACGSSSMINDLNNIAENLGLTHYQKEVF